VRFCDWWFMSLQACATCGYALSTETAQCRHCAGSVKAGSRLKYFVAIQPAYALALLITVSCAIYLLFFR